MKTAFYGGLFCLSLIATACDSPSRNQITEDLTLGGILIPGKTLRGGHQIYDAYCRRCHGMNGDGKGPLGRSQNPPAANFQKGYIKFASVKAGSLPSDADFQRSMRHGLRGTGMLKTGLGDADLQQVTQYLKTFSPRWKTEEAGPVIAIQVNPYKSAEQKKGAIQKGPIISLKAGCEGCHGKVISNVQTGGFKSGTSSEALYRVIAAGIGGTGMKGQEGRLSNEDIWALVEWIRSAQNL